LQPCRTVRWARPGDCCNRCPLYHGPLSHCSRCGMVYDRLSAHVMRFPGKQVLSTIVSRLEVNFKVHWYCAAARYSSLLELEILTFDLVHVWQALHALPSETHLLGVHCDLPARVYTLRDSGIVENAGGRTSRIWSCIRRRPVGRIHRSRPSISTEDPVLLAECTQHLRNYCCRWGTCTRR
jgi:hypothetical protein